ncbi:3'(2'),5'-bisphosphate nucleotidase CysQ [Aureimonas leprariae]|uniref:3'(2'),5'-bisphosphate nucleotidase CysQ n=1 Tax=Plantimonas leprariae TaxID=2615207 RepID=A0A7V7PPP4_9HYPH|nr:3'(2'),5'-bisphosphate nucleotidase CysQ [Aureimonas leprariae]KAB0680028.1 3'(2'),5'-bisphosphate nucleotidase CysQ [Aureimonas leprariae]
MTAPNLDDFLATMIDAAADAGAIVLAFFEGECAARAKRDGSPVTEADRAAETAIERALRERFPDMPVVAEEAIADGHVPPVLGERFFLVDPLDGTKEFVAGLYDFTVNIALVEDGVPVAGVVFAPAYRELFYGSPAGAFKLRTGDRGERGEAVPIAARAEPEAIIAVVSRSHYSTDTDDFLAGHTLESVVPVGSSLKFCRIAEGMADIYPKLGRTMEWDTAAGHAILAAAGGSVTRIDGSPLVYAKRGVEGEADFANPSFIARGRPDPTAAGEMRAGARSRA